VKQSRQHPGACCCHARPVIQEYGLTPIACDLSVASVAYALIHAWPYYALHVHPSQEATAREVAEKVGMRVIADPTLDDHEWYVARFVGSRP
jgi:hypothetical protein